MPEERGEEGEGRPTDEEAEGQGPEEAADDRATYLDEPVRVTPVKVVRWVPKPTAQPPEQASTDGREAPPDEDAPDEGAAPFAIVEGESRDEPAPFIALEEGGESQAPFEDVGPSDEGSAPFEVVGDDQEPAPTEAEGAAFQVVEDQGLMFTEVSEGDAEDEGGPPAPFEEEIEMEPAMELRDEESAEDKVTPPPRRPPAPPAPPGAPLGGPPTGQPPAPHPTQAPPRTVTGIPIARPPPPARSAEAPAQPTKPPAPTPPRPSPAPAPISDEPGYAKYFRPDQDALRPREQGPPSGFDRDLETEAGETDIGIELDRPADKWKRDKAPARPPRDAKKSGQRAVGGRDTDSEVGTRDVGPDIGVSFERRRRRRL